MKKLICFWILGLTLHFFAIGQDLPELSKVKLNKASQYKDAEPIVLKTTHFLLHQDLETEKNTRRKAGQFLINWMNGTPDHIFYLENQDIVYFENSTDYLLSYMAALTQYSLANPQESRINKFIGALEIVIPFLQKHSDSKKWSRELTMLADKFNQNELRVYITSAYFQN